MEVWSFSGLFNAPTNRLVEPDTSLRPWPHLGLWWDGDATMELLDDAISRSGTRTLIVFTTDRPTGTRLYTLARNPAYRNAMTLKGYVQSHHVDHFLGAGMTRPPRPNITYAAR
jgi:hypothetical protein